MLNFKQETVLLRLNYIRKRGKMEWISGLKFIALQSTRIQTQAERERRETVYNFVRHVCCWQSNFACTFGHITGKEHENSWCITMKTEIHRFIRPVLWKIIYFFLKNKNKTQSHYMYLQAPEVCIRITHTAI